MKTFFAIALIVLAIITAWNTMEFWFYSQDVNALRKDVNEIQEQIKELQQTLLLPPDIAKPPPTPTPTPTPDHPPPLDPRPDTSKPDSGGPFYNDNWGWCRELQKADPSFKC